MSTPSRIAGLNGHSRTGVVRYDAAAACDGTGLVVRPVSVLARFGVAGDPTLSLLAIGRLDDVRTHPASGHARVVQLPNSVLVPGFVNAHAHLDLTHIGPQPHDPAAGFVQWVDMIRSRRHTESVPIAASVRRGIELSRAGGTVAIGDIAGSPGGIPNLTPYHTLAASEMRGVSYLEFFGIGTTRSKAPQRMDDALTSDLPRAMGGIRLGLQPHAPNTVDLRLYQWAAELAERRDLALATHLAETPEEREFIATGKGAQRAFLERIGIWDDSILEFIGRGEHPVRHLREILGRARFTVAHVNDADDAAIETLARTQTSVAYCPRASAYFDAEAHFGPHRYQDMLKAGVNVALGTDSIVNLPAEAAGISVLDEMRLLARRDGVDPRTLLRMGTLNGAAALGLDATLFRFQTGKDLAGLVAIETRGVPESEHPFAACLACDSLPTLLQSSD